MTESSRVLVVDDDSQITRVLKTVLESQGYAVRTATDGASPRALVADWQSDLDRDSAIPGARDCLP